MMLVSILSLALFAGKTALAQQSFAWTDPDTNIPFQSYITEDGVRISTAFPNSTTADEFVGQLEVPNTLQWTGLAFGGAMLESLLLLSWPYNGTIQSSPRYTTTYSPPTPYAGPVVTTIAPATYINETHWKFTFRCQNCTTWTGGGSIEQDDISIFGWAISTNPVTTPSSLSTSLHKHTNFGLWGQNVADSHFADYDQILTGSVVSS